jgi:hypothetical protein
VVITTFRGSRRPTAPGRRGSQAQPAGHLPGHPRRAAALTQSGVRGTVEEDELSRAGKAADPVDAALAGERQGLQASRAVSLRLHVQAEQGPARVRPDLGTGEVGDGEGEGLEHERHPDLDAEVAVRDEDARLSHGLDDEERVVLGAVLADHVSPRQLRGDVDPAGSHLRRVGDEDFGDGRAVHQLSGDGGVVVQAAVCPHDGRAAVHYLERGHLVLGRGLIVRRLRNCHDLPSVAPVQDSK